MSDKNKNIIFMGTAAFAVPILTNLIDSQHNIIAVYTKPPSRTSRGMHLIQSPVHNIAERYNLTVVTPKTFKDPEVLQSCMNLHADLAIIAAYGLIIPQKILDAFQYGCINIHPSDLPRWRGAAPIQRSMMACDEKTAICVMKMDAGIDTGPIFTKKCLTLDYHKNIHQLTSEYAALGATMLLEILDEIDRIPCLPQSEIGATYAHKILSIEEVINWQKSAAEIHGQIMALTPNAYFIHNGLKIKVIASELSNEVSYGAQPGSVLTKLLDIVCGDNAVIRLTQLQKPGAKILRTKDFLCGYKLPNGTLIKP